VDEVRRRLDRSRAKFVTIPTAQCQVVVTRYDTVTFAVAGTFEATLRGNHGRYSLAITKVRFDFPFCLCTLLLNSTFDPWP
jgi:hypothetical protein